MSEIAARPADPAPRMAYADWLARRGDERAEFLRLHLLLTECPDDEEFFLLLEREQAIWRRIDDAWLAIMGLDEMYVRLFRLHEGLWLTDSGTLLRWGSPLEKLTAIEDARLEQIEPLGVRVTWKDRVIWRGMRATIHADFIPSAEGDLPGAEHFTIVKPSNWFLPADAGLLATMFHRLMIGASSDRRLAASRAHGEEWLEQSRLRFGSPTGGSVYQRLFKSTRWDWNCATLELLTSEQGEFLCQWLDHPSARRPPELRRIEEAVELGSA